ncbi:hypothetical protein M436DRAFT_66718 [Aureobasidium namibiae CBS 147.97]|uniref:Uncharacterized protein n=1 Tax=Aureobasidium namibiae CBS 147.97 TaxID=1043004 RepID=A0A074WE74_9PEZI|nr:uncharacterized protein M436DRAFT_66718 [Aureobasidium namibiae CBS 147.97]KEQ69859.1 hypothetical protein M436DRAFT_66718 [Aureobasidium namibiae CBS 147.97]
MSAANGNRTQLPMSTTDHIWESTMIDQLARTLSYCMIRFDMSVVEGEMSLRQRRRQHLIFAVRKRDGLRAPLATADIPSGSNFVSSLSANLNGQTYIIAFVDAIPMKPIRTMLICERYAYASILFTETTPALTSSIVTDRFFESAICLSMDPENDASLCVDG